MTRLVLPLILFALATAFSQDDETKCCCTTYDTSVCLGRVHTQTDAALDRTYQQALGRVTSTYTEQDIQNLKDAERLWIAYRDAACKAEYGLWGKGSGGPNAQAMCLIRLTRQRTVELNNAYLSNH